MSSGRLSSSTNCSDNCSRISPASYQEILEDLFIGAEAHIVCSLKTQAGQQVIDIVLTGGDVITLIGMNLRTFTPRWLF